MHSNQNRIIYFLYKVIKNSEKRNGEWLIMIEQRTRKPKPTNYETRIQLRLSQQLYEDLKAYAGEKHMSKVVRRIIENYLYEDGKIIQREELKRKKFMNREDQETTETVTKQHDTEQRTKTPSCDLFID